GHKLLLITVDDPICSSQVFPFFYYQPELASQLGIQLREVSLKQFETSARLTGLDQADTVCFQTWFDRTPEQLSALVAKIREHNPHARVIYLDWFAPTDLRLAEVLHEQVDLYVKKHVFRDRAQYARTTYGDTNLMDFYGKLYDLPHENQHFFVPSDFYARLLVGPSFATADYMLPKFLYGAAPSPSAARPIDLHARISYKGTPWYERMRGEAIGALDHLSDLKVMSGTGVKRRAYLRELASSKLCFSPFGYGEVCWRDYEAAMCGSLLLKPDMSHVETNPDIFRAGETYVPLRWDFADLEEKTRYYLAHPEESARITRNAFSALQKYFREQGFIEHMRSLLNPLPPNRLRLGLERLSGVQLCVGSQVSRTPESASA
ncbi:MAG TPA: glycosyltransferase, partial [Polyangiales bacterium]|nr:glycosyltransferase [Polyangiales bacterium]